MKKRYAAGLALALVGILSGCGQAKTQPADNTISITPVERKTEWTADGYGGEVRILPAIMRMPTELKSSVMNWDGSAWNKDDYGLFHG